MGERGQWRVTVERGDDRAVWRLLDAAGAVQCDLGAPIARLSPADVADLTATFERMAARRQLRLLSSPSSIARRTTRTAPTARMRAAPPPIGDQ